MSAGELKELLRKSGVLKPGAGPAAAAVPLEKRELIDLLQVGSCYCGPHNEVGTCRSLYDPCVSGHELHSLGLEDAAGLFHPCIYGPSFRPTSHVNKLSHQGPLHACRTPCYACTEA